MCVCVCASVCVCVCVCLPLSNFVDVPTFYIVHTFFFILVLIWFTLAASLLCWAMGYGGGG